MKYFEVFLRTIHLDNDGLGKQSQKSFWFKQWPDCVEHNLWPQHPITINLECQQIYDTVNMQYHQTYLSTDKGYHFEVI